VRAPIVRTDRERETVAEAKSGIQTAVLLVLLAAVPIVLLAPLFRAPFETDQGIYATVARGWLHGAVPYRDLWDNKGPVLYLWYVLSIWWVGDSLIMPRLFAAMAAGLSVPFVWAATNTLLGRRVAALAAAWFALSFLNMYLEVTANAEAFMLLPLTVGFWAFARGSTKGGSWWFVAAGVCTSIAVFTRQSALWDFVGYGAWLAVVFLRNPQERRDVAKAGVLLGAGALLASTPFVVYFAVNGALYDMWYGMFAFNWFWAGVFPFYRKLVPPLFWDPWPLWGGLVFWALAAVGVWRLWQRGDRAAWLALSFLIASEAGAQTLGKGSAHYSIQLLPAAAPAGAFGLLYVAERWRQHRRALAVAMVAATAVTLGGAIAVYAQPTSADRFRVQYGYNLYSGRALEAPAIAAAVDQMTRPNDYVYEWGRESEIYFLADRRPASRWVHNRAYAVKPAIISDILTDLKETQPEVILVTDDPAGNGGEPVPASLASYLEERYLYVGSVAYAELYELR
jgi:4-amino-4-deoxy-L-arabinose transferase-like glycosyltransferase